MPKLSKLEFAELVRSMPNAPEEEIFAAAQQREQENEANRGPLSRAWDAVRTPLTDAPSRAAKFLGDKLGPATGPNTTSDSLVSAALGTLPGGPLLQKLVGTEGAIDRVRGFIQGATQGGGDFTSQLTSPLDAATLLAGGAGAVAGRAGLLGISQGARAVEAASMAPLIASGGYNAVRGLQDDNLSQAALGAVEAASGVAGVAGSKQHSFPPEAVRDAYLTSKGRSTAPGARAKSIDPNFSMQVADAYEAMPHDPQHPAVKAAYQAMADETSDQFKFLKEQAGVRMEPWTSEGQPYKNSAEMMADVTKNNRLFYFPSEAGFGESAAAAGNPLLQAGKSGVPVNDEFRAAHDYFGHAVEGNQFGPLGEERAYQAHREMFPPEAVPALTTETRGQNSFVNYGKHLRNESGVVPKKGEPGFVAPQDRPFAEQKTGLLPEELQRADASATVPTPGSHETGTIGASPSSQAYTLDEAASNVAQQTAEHGGSTFNLQKGSLSGTPHYAVSIYPERGVIVDGPATPQDISGFVQKNADLLQDPENSIGTWFNKDDGKTYLDISVTKDNLDDALRLGQDKGQLAIFDLNKFEEIKVPQQGLTNSAPAVSQMAGDVPPEFHAVEPGTAPKPQGFIPEAIETGEQPLPLPKRSEFLKQKESLDTFRRDAAAARGEQKTRGDEVGNFANKAAHTSLGVAVFSAPALVGKDNILDFGDEDTNNIVRAGMTGLGIFSLGKVFAHTPAPKGVFKSEKGFVAVHPLTGRKVKIGVSSNTDNVRALSSQTQGIPEKWQGEFAKVGLKNGTAPPSKPFDQLVQISKGKLKFTKDVEARLRTLYRYGKEKFEAEGGANWLENGIVDDMLKFLPVAQPEVASQRLFASLSPATDVIGNMMDMIRVGLRAKKRHETGALNLTKDAVASDLLRGVGNRPAKASNVARSLKGEPLQSYAAPDPLPAGKVDDLAKGMAGVPDAIPFDMWWARALGLDHDAQPSNGYAYKLLFEAGADIARKNGEDPFPFMAKVWAAMKDLHGGGGTIAPNKLASDIGLGQADLFTGSTLPSGKAAQKLSKQVAQGGAEVTAGLGLNARADRTIAQADEARHLLEVADKTGFKGLRTGRYNKMENAVKKQAYKKFVTDRGPNVEFKQGQDNAAREIAKRLGKLRTKLEGSKQALGKHLKQKLGESELPLDVDNDMLLRRVQEILDPKEAVSERYAQNIREGRAAAKRAGKEVPDNGLPTMTSSVRYLQPRK